MGERRGFGESFQMYVDEIDCHEDQRDYERITEIVQQRWDSIAEANAELAEQLDEASFDPVGHIENLVTEFQSTYEHSENIDPLDAFDIAYYLLALLVEQGAEWPANVRLAVQRVLGSFVTENIGAMNLSQQGAMRYIADIEHKALHPKETELVGKMTQSTTGQ